MNQLPKRVIILFFLVTLIGCNQQTATPREINVYVGTQGLTAEFSKSAPPPKVFEESSFPILIKIRNRGAYSIKDNPQVVGGIGSVLSIGREKDYIPILTYENNVRIKEGATDNERFFYLEGKTQINPQGDELVVAANAKTGRLEPQSESKASTMTATLCYPYRTILSTTVCIDPDYAGIRPSKKVCTVKEITYSSGQGAPIAVTKLETQMIPEGDVVKPQFLIYLENKGQGTPVNIVGFHNTCRKTDYSQKDTWNVAFLKAYGSGDEQLECTPNQEDSTDNSIGFLRFIDKKDFVRCTFKNGIPRTSDAYTSPLRIEIDYGYSQTISANFLMQKPLKY